MSMPKYRPQLSLSQLKELCELIEPALPTASVGIVEAYKLFKTAALREELDTKYPTPSPSNSKPSVTAGDL